MGIGKRSCQLSMRKFFPQNSRHCTSVKGQSKRKEEGAGMAPAVAVEVQAKGGEGGTADP